MVFTIIGIIICVIFLGIGAAISDNSDHDGVAGFVIILGFLCLVGFPISSFIINLNGYNEEEIVSVELVSEGVYLSNSADNTYNFCYKVGDEIKNVTTNEDDVVEIIDSDSATPVVKIFSLKPKKEVFGITFSVFAEEKIKYVIYTN